MFQKASKDVTGSITAVTEGTGDNPYAPFASWSKTLMPTGTVPTDLREPICSTIVSNTKNI